MNIIGVWYKHKAFGKKRLSLKSDLHLGKVVRSTSLHRCVEYARNGTGHCSAAVKYL